ncbi:MAG TPA: hypothetical protein VK503_00850 [Candidatus Bathyarchaeia archaeon]|nr:hypothetical protein [Candidatus Bathyarchaeia archaeon]
MVVCELELSSLILIIDRYRFVSFHENVFRMKFAGKEDTVRTAYFDSVSSDVAVLPEAYVEF